MILYVPIWKGDVPYFFWVLYQAHLHPTWPYMAEKWEAPADEMVLGGEHNGLTESQRKPQQ